MVAEVIDGQLVLMPRPSQPPRDGRLDPRRGAGPRFAAARVAPVDGSSSTSPSFTSATTSGARSGRLAARAHAPGCGCGVLHPGARLGMRSALAPHGHDRPLRQAAHLRARAGGSRMARQSPGAQPSRSCDAKAPEVARRRLERRGAGASGALRRDRARARGALGGRGACERWSSPDRACCARAGCCST